LGVPYAIFFQVFGVRWSLPVMGSIALAIPAGVFVFTRRSRAVPRGGHERSRQAGGAAIADAHAPRVGEAG
jgi:hypothetical protein